MRPVAVPVIVIAPKCTNGKVLYVEVAVAWRASPIAPVGGGDPAGGLTRQKLMIAPGMRDCEGS